MGTNVGGIDRIVRLVAGLGLGTVALFSGLPAFAAPLLYWASLAIAATLVVTAAVRFCPLYSLLGISTCKVSH